MWSKKTHIIKQTRCVCVVCEIIRYNSYHQKETIAWEKVVTEKEVMSTPRILGKEFT